MERALEREGYERARLQKRPQSAQKNAGFSRSGVFLQNGVLESSRLATPGRPP